MASAAGQDVFMPKALLVRNPTGDDDWIDSISRKISDELREKHIAVTSDRNEIDTAHMIIVFLNSTFLIECHQLLKQMMDYAFGTPPMLLTAVVYESNDDSKPLCDIFRRFDGSFPQNFDFNTDDPDVKERLTKLVLRFLNRTNTMFCTLPYSSNDKNAIRGILRPFIDRLVTDLNPLHLDISKIPPALLSEVLGMYHHKMKGMLRVGKYEPLLALFKFLPCMEHGCSSQTMTIIIQLLYTYLNIFKQMECRTTRLYVSMPPIKSGEEPPSFATVFRSAFDARFPVRSDVIYPHEPFLLVIDDFQKFVPEGVDPKYLLARILEQLGHGSLVITSIPYSLKVDTIDTEYCLGPVGGMTRQCTHSPVNTSSQPWPLCYALYSDELGKLSMEDEDFVMDDVDSKEATLSWTLPLFAGHFAMHFTVTKHGKEA